MVVVSRRSDESKSSRRSSNLNDDLLLHQVEAHRQDGHAQQDVDRAYHQFGFGFLKVLQNINLCEILVFEMTIHLQRYQRQKRLTKTKVFLMFYIYRNRGTENLTNIFFNFHKLQSIKRALFCLSNVTKKDSCF